MEKSKIKKEKDTTSKTFLDAYNEIMGTKDNVSTLNTQWKTKGDFFQKFTMYDTSYKPVKTLGGTTLIKI